MRLRDRMPNGGTVSDWLGTAMTASRIASGILSDFREGRPGAPIVRNRTDDQKVILALAHAEQAVAEIRTVLRHFGIEPEGEAYNMIREGRL